MSGVPRTLMLRDSSSSEDVVAAELLSPFGSFQPPAPSAEDVAAGDSAESEPQTVEYYADRWELRTRLYSPEGLMVGCIVWTADTTTTELVFRTGYGWLETFLATTYVPPAGPDAALIAAHIEFSAVAECDPTILMHRHFFATAPAVAPAWEE